MATSPAGSNEAELLRLWISVNHDAINTHVGRIVDEFRVAISKTIKEELETFRTRHGCEPSANASTPPIVGVQLGDGERHKAADLRNALLLGKVPEDAGLLIDVKTTAKLLNVSSRTLYRLNQLGMTPDPVRVGRLVRFRLAELLAWIEADCPPKKHWSYSDVPKAKRRK